MKRCKYCGKDTPNTRIWKYGSHRYIAPFCNDKCRDQYADVKEKIMKQKKIENI